MLSYLKSVKSEIILVIAAGTVVDTKVPSYSIYRKDGSIEKIMPS